MCEENLQDDSCKSPFNVNIKQQPILVQKYNLFQGEIETRKKFETEIQQDIFFGGGGFSWLFIYPRLSLSYTVTLSFCLTYLSYL